MVVKAFSQSLLERKRKDKLINLWDFVTGEYRTPGFEVILQSRSIRERTESAVFFGIQYHFARESYSCTEDEFWRTTSEIFFNSVPDLSQYNEKAF